jgi:2-polyprenyl-3-methyl-5-hydroxy-6-metoxy-1,4-benzoquinol methylase
MGTSSKYKAVSRHEYDEEWIKETWGWDTPEYFIRNQGRNLRPRIRTCLNLARLKPGMRVLDIGCGRGEIVLHCGRLGIDAYGVDYSKQALEIADKARLTHSSAEQDRMHFILDDVKNLEFRELFDRIFLLDIVEHLHDWELTEVIDVCKRLLKPSGVLIIHTLPNKWLYDITYSRMLRLFMPWLPADPRSDKEKSIHINEMTIIHLGEILHRSGFRSRVWLQDLIVEQARWHQKQPLNDQRGKIYQLLSHPLCGAIYKMIAKTPLKLLIVNEIFAAAWIGKQSPPIELPSGMTERFILKIFSK